ncbi:hypothetical protein FBU30_005845 [Linnemannia zychae]|nr:hypothetical protein FBU30_005845 [Linnemannia zychae]
MASYSKSPMAQSNLSCAMTSGPWHIAFGWRAIGEKDTKIKPLRLGTEELFDFVEEDNSQLRVSRRLQLNNKMLQTLAQLTVGLHQGRHKMRQGLIQATRSPAKIAQEDTIATRVQSIVLVHNSKRPITLENMTTKQLRLFLELQQRKKPDHNFTVHPETGSSKQWRQYWKAMIQYTTKKLWSEEGILSILSLQPPSLEIKPDINITRSQLVACCLIVISTANSVLFLHQQSLSRYEIIHCIKLELMKSISQIKLNKPH